MITPTYTKPGQLFNVTSQPRDCFFGNRQAALNIPLPLTIDGNLSSNPLNSPYTWVLWAGTPMGKITATKKFRNSIIGLTTANYTSGGTSLTVSAATAAEVARLITLAGTSITLTITGGTTAGGTPSAISTTCSAASGTTLTITNLAANVIIGSLVQPADGSQTITTILTDDNNAKIIDALNTTRVDIFNGNLLANCSVVINSAMIPYYSSMDAGVQAYVVAAIQSAMLAVRVQDYWL